MTVNDAVAAMVRYWFVILACILLGALCAFGLRMTAQPVYLATSSLLVEVLPPTDDVAGEQDAVFVARLLRDNYLEIVQTAYVLKPVVSSRDGMSVDQLASRMVVAAPTGTSIIEIGVIDPSPDDSASLANAITTQLVYAVGDDESIRPERVTTEIRLTVLDRASAPSGPMPRENHRDLVIGGGAGAIVGIAAAVFLTRRRLRVTDTSEPSLDAASI